MVPYLEGMQGLAFFGDQEDVDLLPDFLKARTAVYANELEFLSLLKSQFDCVVFPLGVRRPEVTPIPSIVMVITSALSAKTLPMWTLADCEEIGLKVSDVRSISLRSDLVLTDSLAFRDLILNNAGTISANIHVMPGGRLAPDVFCRYLKELPFRYGSDFGGRKQVRFTIVTPSFNHAEFIEETIESVLSQDYPDIDYWVIDGGSTDGTIDILKKYEGRGLRWISEKDRGYAEAVNKGIVRATGDYFAWLPSDDVYADTRVLSRMAAVIEKNHHDVIYGDALYTDIRGTVVDYYRIEDYTPTRLLDWCLICQPAAVIALPALRAASGLSEDLKSIADYDLWMRLSRNGATFERVGFSVACYRLHPESITTRQKLRSYLEIFQTQEKCLGIVGPTWVRAAVGELRETRLGLANISYVRPVKCRKIGPSMKVRILRLIKWIVGWEILLRCRIFQKIVRQMILLSVLIGRWRDHSLK